MGARRRRSDRAGRAAMSSPGRPSVGRRQERQRFWAAIARGVSSEDAAGEAGVSVAVGVRWFREGGGMPTVTQPPAVGALPVIRRARRDRDPARPRVWRSRDRALTRSFTLDDLARAAPPRRHAQRRSGVSRQHRAVARRSARQAPEDRDARRQQPAARLGPGPARGRCAAAGRKRGRGTRGAVDRSASRAPQGSPLGEGVEPGADL